MSKMQNAIPEADRPKLDPSQAAAPAWAEDLIIDEATGAVLSPGKPEICQGNGFHVNVDGDAIECCCDECDYLQLCFEDEPNTEAIIRQVDGSMAIEGMALSADDKERIRQTAFAPDKVEAVVEGLVKKHSVGREED